VKDYPFSPQKHAGEALAIGPRLRQSRAGGISIYDFRFAIALLRLPRCAVKIKYNTRMQEYYVYILTKKQNGTLYVGMTKDLATRTARHKTGRGSKFVQKYNIDKLVYYEKVKSYREARSRERQLKWWKRKWKLALIEQMNPEWRDMSKEILGPR
jgi:putative endonuclease